ncbi:uncharacterized protein LOC118184539 isoform X2 [Stegodyphus dumicola]|nr:uncharacterized protein LOC118184539 isoform X2 [Stegodyphus dumicola]XP_035210122.1 uncharacterized protein LOC118184539 isoform X2 [Stegodyphus dumicola]
MHFPGEGTSALSWGQQVLSIHQLIMADFIEETERHYEGRRRLPHCRTCVCPQQEVKMRSKVFVSTHSKPKPPVSPFGVEPRGQKCICGCRRSTDGEWECRNKAKAYYHQSVVSPNRVERKIHAEHKYTLLENWFNRFDLDCNGLLDVFELKSLFNFLGVNVPNDYVSRLLERADRDRDGCLSFPEFMHMWRQIQYEDEFYDIIREHDLFPDVLPLDRCPTLYPRHQVTETVRRKFGRVRQCGCEGTITKTYRRSPKDHTMELKTKISHSPAPREEKFPVFLVIAN